MFKFAYVQNYNIERDVGQIIEQSKNVKILVIINNYIYVQEKKTLDLLVFVVITDKAYRAVKYFGDVTYGIVTRCMRYNTIILPRNLDENLGNVLSFKLLFLK